MERQGDDVCLVVTDGILSLSLCLSPLRVGEAEFSRAQCGPWVDRTYSTLQYYM